MPAQMVSAPPARLERAEAAECDLEGWLAYGRERRGYVLARMAIDLPNEAQSEVELLVALPARPADPAHRCEQALANQVRRANGDEQTAHGVPLSRSAPSSVRLRLKEGRNLTILHPFGGLSPDKGV